MPSTSLNVRSQLSVGNSAMVILVSTALSRDGVLASGCVGLRPAMSAPDVLFVPG
jgi:hypothetical protein